MDIMKHLRVLAMLALALLTGTACDLARAQSILAEYFTKASDNGKFAVAFYREGSTTGFESTIPASPVAGNTGTTLGEQRVNATMAAVNYWSNAFESKITVPVLMYVRVNKGLPCGRAMVTEMTSIINSSRNTAYPAALANQMAGRRLYNSQADFYVEVSGNVGCPSFYYGITGNPGSNQLDFFRAMLHEIAHGLGLSSRLDRASGNYRESVPSSFDRQLWDIASNRPWTELTPQARLQSLSRTRAVAFVGDGVHAGILSNLQQGVAQLRISSPALGRDRDAQWPIYLATPKGLGPAPDFLDIHPVNFRYLSAVWNACDTKWTQGRKLQGRIAFVLFPGYPACPVDKQIRAMKIAGADGVLFGTYPGQSDFTDFGNIRVTAGSGGNLQFMAIQTTVPPAEINIPSARLMAYEDMVEMLVALAMMDVPPPRDELRREVSAVAWAQYLAILQTMYSGFSRVSPASSVAESYVRQMEERNSFVDVEFGINTMQYMGSVPLRLRSAVVGPGIEKTSDPYDLRRTMLVDTRAKFNLAGTQLPVDPGSAIGHWDVMARRGAQGAGVLMRSTTTLEVIAAQYRSDVDITWGALMDIGWKDL